MTSRVLYRAQYHRQHCTLQAFEQFVALYIDNPDDIPPSRPGVEPQPEQPERMSHRGWPVYCEEPLSTLANSKPTLVQRLNVESMLVNFR